MRAVFADPKTDFVFKRIFGSEAHKPLLIALLEALLELDAAHRILDLEFLAPEQHLPIEEFKLSIVDVKCRDASGRLFVVEMQVLNVEGFEKRVVYNSAKAYVETRLPHVAIEFFRLRLPDHRYHFSQFLFCAM